MSQNGIIWAAVGIAVIALWIVFVYTKSPQTYNAPTGNPPATNFQGPTGAPSMNGPTSNPPSGY